MRRFGPVSVLPTPVFFYGMQPNDEIAIEIEPGKTLVLLLVTIGETDEEGQVKVFFELNGQQRIIKVQNRSAAVTKVGAAQGRGRQRLACRRADAGRRLDHRGAVRASRSRPATSSRRWRR